jgi:hypothetical protein
LWEYLGGEAVAPVGFTVLVVVLSVEELRVLDHLFDRFWGVKPIPARHREFRFADTVQGKVAGAGLPCGAGMAK